MKSKRILNWISIAFFILLALVYFPSISSLLGIIAATLMVPAIQRNAMGYVKKPILVGIIALIMLLSIMLAPTNEDNTTVAIPIESATPSVQTAVINPVDEQKANTETGEEIPSIPEESPAATNTVEAVPTPAVGSSFEVHYLDVGQGDSALVICDGHAMLIDGGTPEHSSRIVSYLKKLEIQHLDYVVASHAHNDHSGGLSGALNVCSVGRVFSSVTEHDGDAFNDLIKYAKKQDKTVEKLITGDSFTLGSSTVNVLSPSHYYDDHNNDSLVLKITYGNTSFLFTGDANHDAERDILDTQEDVSAAVLKVGHHGSDNASSYAFLREVMPAYAVISCGEENSYGHPTEAVLSRLRDAETEVYRTDLHGTIVCTSDGQTVSFTTENESAPEEVFLSGEALANRNSAERNTEQIQRAEAEQMAEVGIYIGNVNSHKFHESTCKTLPKEENRIYFNSREEAIGEGFDPCGNCDP